MDTTQRKRERYSNFLEDVPLLSSLSDFERSTIADALAAESVQTGHEIIRQGDIGDRFYIIEHVRKEAN